MSTTMLDTEPTPGRTDALRYYRLAVLALAVVLAAMIAATVYLAVRSEPAAVADRNAGGSTSQDAPLLPAADRCFRPAVPC
jgi:hypothetical protein